MIFGWYMLEEEELYPNGKFFNAKLEEWGGGFRDRNIFISERVDRSTIDEKAREEIFLVEI